MGLAAPGLEALVAARLHERRNAGSVVLHEATQQALQRVDALAGAAQRTVEVQARQRREPAEQRRARVRRRGPAGAIVGFGRQGACDGGGQPAQQRRVQVFGIDGLGDVVVHARGQAGGAVLAEGVRGHRDDRHVQAPAAQLACRLDAVAAGHLHVHQHHVVGRCEGHRDGPVTVLGELGAQADGAQQFECDFLVDRVVFGEQHAVAPAAPAQRGLGHARRHDRGQRLGLVAHHAGEHVVQRRGGDRLDEHRVEARRQRIAPHRRVVVGGDQHGRRQAVAEALAQPAEQRDAVHRRHAPVEQQRVVGGAGARRPIGLFECLRAGVGLVHTHAEQAQPVAEGAACLGQVVHEQHATARQRGRCRRLGAAMAEPRGEPEPAALAGCTLDTRCAAHQLGQPACQRETESGAAGAARGRAVELLEGVEQRGLALGRNAAAGVLHDETNVQALAFVGQAFGAHAHEAALGELDGVGQQVQQRLRQPGRVAEQPVGQGVGVDHQLEALLAGRVGHHLEAARDHRVEREVDRFQAEPAGLDLEQVEDVVDLGAAGRFGRVARRGELGVAALQLGLRTFEGAHVEGHHEHAVYQAVVAAVGHVVHQVHDVAVGARGAALELERLAGQRRLEARAMLLEVGRADDLGGVASDRHVRREAEPLVVGPVGEAAAQLAVPVGDAAGQVVGDRAQETFGVGELHVGQLKRGGALVDQFLQGVAVPVDLLGERAPFGDVGERGDDGDHAAVVRAAHRLGVDAEPAHHAVAVARAHLGAVLRPAGGEHAGERHLGRRERLAVGADRQPAGRFDGGAARQAVAAAVAPAQQPGRRGVAADQVPVGVVDEYAFFEHLDHRAIVRLAVGLRGEHLLAFGHVARDAEQADHRTAGIPQRAPDGHRDALAGGRGHPLGEALVAAGGDHAQVVRAQSRGCLGVEEFAVQVPEHLGHRARDIPRCRPVAGEVAALQILREDRVVRVLGDLLEQLQRAQPLGLLGLRTRRIVEGAPLPRQPHPGRQRHQRGEPDAGGPECGFPGRGIDVALILLCDQPPVRLADAAHHRRDRFVAIVARREWHADGDLAAHRTGDREGRVRQPDRGPGVTGREAHIVQPDELARVGLPEDRLAAGARHRPAAQQRKQPARRIGPDHQGGTRRGAGLEQRDDDVDSRPGGRPVRPVDAGVEHASLGHRARQHREQRRRRGVCIRHVARDHLARAVEQQDGVRVDRPPQRRAARHQRLQRGRGALVGPLQVRVGELPARAGECAGVGELAAPGLDLGVAQVGHRQQFGAGRLAHRPEVAHGDEHDDRGHRRCRQRVQRPREAAVLAMHGSPTRCGAPRPRRTGCSCSGCRSSGATGRGRRRRASASSARTWLPSTA